PTLWEFILIAVLLNIVTTLTFELIVQHFITSIKNDRISKLISIAVIVLSPILLVMIALLLFQYPKMFASNFLLLDTRIIPAFLGLTFLSQSWTAILLQKLDTTNWRSSSTILWIERHLPGLLSASAITASTYLLGTVLVSPNLGLADN